MRTPIKVISLGHRIPQTVKNEIEISHPGVLFFEYPMHLNWNSSTVVQVRRMAERSLSEAECRDQIPFLILPGVTVAAALVIAVVSGIVGCLPYVIEICKDPENRSAWKVKTIHNLEEVRGDARSRRFI